VQGHPERLTKKEKPVVKRAVGVLALVTVLAACQVPASPGPRPGPVTTSAAPVAVEWADKLCGAILEYDSGTPRVEVDSSSQDAAIKSLNTVLEKMSIQINGTLDRLGTIGQAPVPGGDEAAQNLASALERLRTVVDRSRSRLLGVDTNDRPGTTAALQEVAQDLQTLKEPVNPLEGMGQRFPELQAAARSADNCTEISRVRASRAALPPEPSYPDDFPTGTSTPDFPGSSTTPTQTTPTQTTQPTF
jgi:hypothetical protein